MNTIYIFYHLFCVNDCIDRFNRSYTKIKESGLLDKVQSIYVVLVGNERNRVYNEILNIPKVIPILKDDSKGESETLKLLWDKCNEEECNVLYLHGKGVTRGVNAHIDSWVEYMEYFCIKQHEKCLRALQQYDTCGVNLSELPMYHYSGNFWWSTSKFIKTRDRYDCNKSTNIKDERWYCEFWLLDAPNCNPTTLHQSDVDHYCTIYDKKQYER